MCRGEGTCLWAFARAAQACCLAGRGTGGLPSVGTRHPPSQGPEPAVVGGESGGSRLAGAADAMGWLAGKAEEGGQVCWRSHPWALGTLWVNQHLGTVCLARGPCSPWARIQEDSLVSVGLRARQPMKAPGLLSQQTLTSSLAGDQIPKPQDGLGCKHTKSPTAGAQGLVRCSYA